MTLLDNQLKCCKKSQFCSEIEFKCQTKSYDGSKCNMMVSDYFSSVHYDLVDLYVLQLMLMGTLIVLVYM